MLLWENNKSFQRRLIVTTCRRYRFWSKSIKLVKFNKVFVVQLCRSLRNFIFVFNKVFVTMNITLFEPLLCLYFLLSECTCMTHDLGARTNLTLIIKPYYSQEYLVFHLWQIWMHLKYYIGVGNIPSSMSLIVDFLILVSKKRYAR